MLTWLRKLWNYKTEPIGWNAYPDYGSENELPVRTIIVLVFAILCWVLVEVLCWIVT